MAVILGSVLVQQVVSLVGLSVLESLLGWWPLPDQRALALLKDSLVKEQLGGLVRQQRFGLVQLL